MICYIPQGFYNEYVASLVEVNVQFSSDFIWLMTHDSWPSTNRLWATEVYIIYTVYTYTWMRYIWYRICDVWLIITCFSSQPHCVEWRGWLKFGSPTVLCGVILSDALCELPCVHEPASCYKRVVSGLYIHTVETYNLSETWVKTPIVDFVAVEGATHFESTVRRRHCVAKPLSWLMSRDVKRIGRFSVYLSIDIHWYQWYLFSDLFSIIQLEMNSECQGPGKAHLTAELAMSCNILITLEAGPAASCRSSLSASSSRISLRVWRYRMVSEDVSKTIMWGKEQPRQGSH